MNRHDFLAQVDDARQRHPVWFELPSDQAPDDEVLAETERRLGSRLPDDFRWFLPKYGGGDFAFATLYSADSESGLDLVGNQSEGTPGVVGFGDDGTGNVFVFPVDDGACRDRVLVGPSSRPAGSHAESSRPRAGAASGSGLSSSSSAS